MVVVIGSPFSALLFDLGVRGQPGSVTQVTRNCQDGDHNAVFPHGASDLKTPEPNPLMVS
jgi:hypothetical protein